MIGVNYFCRQKYADHAWSGIGLVRVSVDGSDEAQLRPDPGYTILDGAEPVCLDDLFGDLDAALDGEWEHQR